MSKKLVLLALTVVSAALFALSAAASAGEIHFEGPTAFTGAGGAGSIVATEEPTVTFESNDVTGTINAGGTTGNISFDLTGCHKFIFGFTAKCHTAGSPKDTTVAWDGAFHFITWKTAVPAVLFTPNTLEVLATGASSTHYEGNGIIGTVTSPKCGETSATMTIVFSATGSTQDHIVYTNVNYDLKHKTVPNDPLITAGFNASMTLSFGKSGTLNCT